jgi:C-terminal processing protease CtpA/Prc
MFRFCEPESCCPTFKTRVDGERLDGIGPNGENGTCGVGIGLRFDSVRQKIVVGSLAPGGPAYKSFKIEKDDALLKIDGKEISSMKPSQLGPLLQGARGSVVQLELVRYVDNYEVPIKVSLVRNWNMGQISPNSR